MSGSSPGIPESILSQRHRERQLLLPLVGRCAFCKWSTEGTSAEVMKRQRRHAFKKHGIVWQGLSRRHLRNLKSFASAPLTDDDWDDIEQKVRRRKHLYGVDA